MKDKLTACIYVNNQVAKSGPAFIRRTRVGRGKAPNSRERNNTDKFMNKYLRNKQWSEL